MFELALGASLIFHPSSFFTDPVLRAPTIGSMLMCLVAALVGVLVFVQKRSLIGEALSHATYPGVTAAIIFAGFFSFETRLPFLLPVRAFCSSLLGFWVIDCLGKKLKVAPDAALSVTLALFFGIGVTIASFAQNSYTHLYRQMQTYLYGQAATMTDIHIYLYAILALIVLLFITVFYKEILALVFDAEFASTCGIPKRFINLGIFLIIVLTLVIGVRCVGVILMSAMLIAPAAAARQFTNRLPNMFFLSGIFGVLSAFLGICGSVIISEKMGGHYSIPTGPMIVLISGSIALYALFFAPRRGLLSRYARIAKFRGTCLQENFLKALWRLSQEGQIEMSFEEIAQRVGFSSPYLYILLFRLCRKKELARISHTFSGNLHTLKPDLDHQGNEAVLIQHGPHYPDNQSQASERQFASKKCEKYGLVKKTRRYQLTSLGIKRAARIVRLHRLWEVYLVNSLGFNVERVHKSAEEMEHILTPELEKKLMELLDNPTIDPHKQPIPSQEGVINVF